MNYLISTANYHSEKDTLLLLKQVYELSIETSHKFTFLVFDNSNSLEEKQLNCFSSSPRFKLNLIKPKRNIGLSPTWKVSIKNFLGTTNDPYDALILINNDTIFQNHFFDILESALNVKKDAVLGPCIYLSNGEPWSLGGRFGLLPWSVKHFGDERLLDVNSGNLIKTDHLSGCCLILSKGALKSFLDISGISDFFFRGEEWFINKRLEALGVDRILVKNLKLIHNENGSHDRFSSAHIYWAVRAKMLFIKKMNRFEFWISILTYSLHIFTKGFIFYYKNSDDSVLKVARSIVKGYLHGLSKNVVRQRDYHK